MGGREGHRRTRLEDGAAVSEAPWNPRRPPLWCEYRVQRAESRPVTPSGQQRTGTRTPNRRETRGPEARDWPWEQRQDRRVTRPEMACSGNARHGEGAVSDSAPDPSPLSSSSSSGARMSPVTLHKGSSQAPSSECVSSQSSLARHQAPGTSYFDTTEGVLTYSSLHNYYTFRAPKTKTKKKKSGRKASKVKLFQLALMEVIRRQVLDFPPCSAGVGLFLHERT
ncbi:hypothetical protein TESG_08442 [Trichophyton tonsurans CBS 112818]|uniref:Uncharacterized protein n=1 Tax=Trichophyton tonsurans (strain CBS 112818) TaxID=647933 RepID=F2RYP3_TRIT1|nr:hypothetical protein TESG_08442 [Trichophyton tonsurans CBS 112818]